MRFLDLGFSQYSLLRSCLTLCNSLSYSSCIIALTKSQKRIIPVTGPFSCPVPDCISTTAYDTLRSVAQHCRAKHAGKIPNSSMVQDGSKKIPCPYGCSARFTSYSEADKHIKPSRNDCSIAPPKAYPYPWGLYTGCDITCVSQEGLANHIRQHERDPRGPYQCSVGCEQFFADAYVLGSHQERCTGARSKQRDGSIRTIFIPHRAATTVVPQVIVVIRSSAEPPAAWNLGLEGGLHAYGMQIIRQWEYASGSQVYQAVLHAYSFVARSDLPAPEHDNSVREKTGSRRQKVHRAFEWIESITGDITAANRAGVTPTLLSVGIDGSACHGPAILDYLQRSLKRALSFHLTLRVPFLHYGLSPENFICIRNVYWLTLNVDDIHAALEGRGGSNAAQQLVDAWSELQRRKGLQSMQENMLHNGRNVVK